MADVKIGSRMKANVLQKEKIHTLLESGELGAMIDWKVWDPKTGKVLEKVSRKSESYVRQFLELLFVQMTHPPRNYGVDVRDTSNTVRTVVIYDMQVTNYNYIFDVREAAAGTFFGIRVGTGNTAPTINDYALQTPIVHGAGAGQLQYDAVAFGIPAADTTTSQLVITRNFSNASGGAIVVEEVGLICRAFYPTAAGYFLIIRDVTGGINVPNGQTLTVNYRLQAVV